MRKMKDSGIAWIGEIPAEWSREKIFRVFQTIGSGTTPKSGNPDYYNGDVHWVQSGDINGGIITDTKSSVTDAAIKHFSALKIYDAPFIIMAMYGASIGNLSISKINGCVNQACCVMKDCNQDMEYSFYSLKTAKDFLIWKGVGGGQPNISQDTIKQLWIPLPPLDEQHRIAAYLDEKCAHIDAVIEKTRASIDEYKKLKQAVITRAVTKGLRKGRKMKDSGIEWIGEIPEEWKIRPLKGVTKRIIVGLATSVTKYYKDQGIPIFRNLNIKEDMLMDDDILYLDEEWASLQTGKMIRTGDILTVHTGYVGISCIVPKKYDKALTFTTLISTPNKEMINTRFLMWYINISRFYSPVYFNVETGAQNNLNTKAFVNLEIAVPPLPEQQEIASYLDAKIAAIDRLIAKKEQLAAEMESCKKSLIYEVVTGKREVH